MKSRTLKLKVSESIGAVSAIITEPDQMKAIMTFAHGAGAGMTHSFMEKMSGLLAAHNIGTLRFNFPFVENKKGRPDLPAVAHKTIEAAIRKAHELFPAIPLYASGKSFGGRMTSQWLAKEAQPDVRGVIFFGFPLHAPGKPTVERAAHLMDVRNHMLFLQGTRDTLAQWDLIEEVCKRLKNATLVKWEGADHSFKVAKKDIMGDLAIAVQNWIDVRNGVE